MALPDRPHRLHMLLSEEEQLMLINLADLKETTNSQVIRDILRAAHAAAFPARHPKMKPTK